MKTLSMEQHYLNRLKSVQALLKEASFCIEYGADYRNKDAQKFYALGLKVIGDMSICLEDIKDELNKDKRS